VVSAGTYVLGALSLLVVGSSIGFTAYRLRRRLLPAWTGAPARLVESITALALLIWLGELLGTFGLFDAWTLVVVSALLAVLTWTLLSGGGVDLGDHPEEAALAAPAAGGGTKSTTGPAGSETFAWLVTIGVIALVVAHWGLTTKEALDRGIFNFDSLWYHMPFAVDMAKSHSTTGLHYVETVFTNWFYPQNSELLHATGILLTQRDTLSLFLNFAFLGLAFLAAWCIGRPYGRGHLTVVAAAILLECHTLVVREPGAAKNDLVAAALLLAAVAILVNAWTTRDVPSQRGRFRPLSDGTSEWALVAGGLAVGMAVGTKSTAVAMAFALTVAVIALAPAGRRWAAAGWWLIPALLGGGYWYLRNLLVAGNPLPQVTSIGPISLPHPERLQEGRPDFSIAHYATDTGVWRHYFAPGVHEAFGFLWPLVLAAAVGGAVLSLLRGKDKMLRWAGAVALFGLVAYLFTPLTAAGAEGAPIGFGINIRYGIPPLLLGLTLLPIAFGRLDGWREWTFAGALLATLLITDRADAVLRDPNRLFGLALALMLVVLPAMLIWACFRADRSRAAGRRRLALVVTVSAFGALVVALGYPLQRHYLRDRFAAGSEIPGMRLEAAYRWARDKSGARIGIVGTTAGFLQYGLYGTDLSNRVIYLGEKGPHGAFNAIPTCTAFRGAVNDADLEYLVTAPFLNFLHPDEPIASPEAHWLRGDPAARPLLRTGPVTLWKVNGRLDPSACGPANRPLYGVPNTPQGRSG
jgi:4-amino-4-deoxy-L-arabinose transferase-like glycosyltransferase